MALPDYGDAVPANPDDEMKDYIDGAGVGAWGGTKSGYVANIIASFPLSDPVRQRFNNSVSLRQKEATARVERYTPLISDVFPSPTYQSEMTDRDARRIVLHSLNHPIDYLASDYILFAVQQLGIGSPTHVSWKRCVVAVLDGEVEIRDTANAYVDSLPIPP